MSICTVCVTHGYENGRAALVRRWECSIVLAILSEARNRIGVELAVDVGERSRSVRCFLVLDLRAHAPRVDPQQHEVLPATEPNVRDLGDLMRFGAVDEAFRRERVHAVDAGARNRFATSHISPPASRCAGAPSIMRMATAEVVRTPAWNGGLVTMTS